MNPHHHPDSSTLIGYSAGALPTAFRVVVAAHLGICGLCRSQLLAADQIGGLLLNQQQGAPLSAGARAAMLDRIGAPVSPQASAASSSRMGSPRSPDDLPEALQPYFGATFSGLRWRTIGPGMHHVRAQDVTDSHLMLLRIAPGRSVPLHSHGGSELTMIMRGAYDDCLGHFAPGDIADLDSEVEHQPVTSPGVPCVCVAATDLPLRFSGWLARTLQPLFKL